jgi:hypothetical protein
MGNSRRVYNFGIIQSMYRPRTRRNECDIFVKEHAEKKGNVLEGMKYIIFIYMFTYFDLLSINLGYAPAPIQNESLFAVWNL